MAPAMDSARWLAIKDLVVPTVRINSLAEAKKYLCIFPNKNKFSTYLLRRLEKIRKGILKYTSRRMYLFCSYFIITSKNVITNLDPFKSTENPDFH